MAMKGFLYTTLSTEGAEASWEDLVVDAVGNVIEFWGFKRNQGRVWALIFLRGVPMTSQDLQDELGLSKGAVSMLTRELERWEVLRRVRLPNSSSWRFDVETDLRRMVSNVFREREAVFISRVRADLAEAEIKAREEGVPAEVLARLHRMQTVAEAMAKALELFLASATLDLGKVVSLLRDTGIRKPILGKSRGRRLRRST